MNWHIKFLMNDCVYEAEKQATEKYFAVQLK